LAFLQTVCPATAKMAAIFSCNIIYFTSAELSLDTQILHSTNLGH
jgi:hypothetical protein